MAAYVVQAAYLSVVAPKDKHGVGIHLDCEVVARFGKLAGMAGEEPTVPPDTLDVPAIDGVVGVKRAGQGPARLALCGQRIKRTGGLDHRSILL